jgi:hypothetical protein
MYGGDDYFSVVDTTKMLKLKLGFAPKTCNPLILRTIPRDMCKEITKSDLNVEYYSGFDKDNTGPVYVYLGNSYEFLWGEHYEKVIMGQRGIMKLDEEEYTLI